MTFAIVGVLCSVAAVAYALATNNAALMIFGVVAFVLALFCLDKADSRQYARHSDSINGR